MRQLFYNDNSDEVAVSWLELAHLYNAQKDYKETEQALDQALSIRKKIYGNEHPKVSEVENLIAEVKEKIRQQKGKGAE